MRSGCSFNAVKTNSSPVGKHVDDDINPLPFKGGRTCGAHVDAIAAGADVARRFSDRVAAELCEYGIAVRPIDAQQLLQVVLVAAIAQRSAAPSLRLSNCYASTLVKLHIFI